MLLVLFGRLAQFALALVTVRVLTTLLSPEEVGKVTLVVTATTFFAMFLVNPVGMFINRKIHAWVQGKVFLNYFHVYLFYLLAVAFFALVAVPAVLSFIPFDFGFSPWLVALLIGLSLFFNTVNQTLVPSLNLLGYIKPFVVLTLSTLLASLLCAVLLVTGWLPAAQGWLLGVLAGQVLFSGIAYLVFFNKVPAGNGENFNLLGSLSQNRVRQVFSFCWPVSIAVGLNWLHMQGYRFYLSDQLGLYEFGLFAAGYGVAAALIAAMEQVLTTWFQPQFYAQANSSDPQVRQSAWKNYALLIIPVSVLGVSSLIAVADDLVFFMLGASFQNATQYVIAGAFAEWARVLVGVYVLIAHLRMDTRSLVLPNLLGLLVAFALLAFAFPYLSALAAPMAAAVGGVVVCVYMYIKSASSGYEIDLPLLRIFFLGLLAFGMAAVAFFVRSVVEVSNILDHFLFILAVSVLWAPLLYSVLVAKFKSKGAV